MDARELRAEPLGELGAVAAQRFVLDHAMALGHPGDAAHQIEVAAQNGGIAAEPERLGHADAGGMGGPEDRELLRPPVADGQTRGRVGSQDHVPNLAADLRRHQPILLDRPALQRQRLEDARGAAGRAGNETGKACLGLRAPPGSDAASHDQKSVPSVRKAPASTILWTSEAPSTRRAWRA